MRRYWVGKKAIKDNLVTLEGDVLHHIVDVCRQTSGSQFEVLNGDGQAYFVELISAHKKQALCKVLNQRKVIPLPKPFITLFVSMPKFSKFDLILQKCVELGVFAVQPFVSQFSYVRTKDKISDNKVKRWGKIIHSATEQCGRGDFMELRPLKTFDEIVNEFNPSEDGKGLFAYEGECDKNLKQALRELPHVPEHLWVFVGSEGGFSKDEVLKFKQINLEPITLGEHVLRVETACLALVSMIKYEMLLNGPNT